MDLFTGHPREEARASYVALEAEVNRRFSPQEPATTERAITRLTRADYQGGERVTFEMLLGSFGLQADPGLSRLAALVYYLDIGGLSVAEAAGLEALLAGLRVACPDDNALFAAASPVLDALQLRFSTPDT